DLPFPRFIKSIARPATEPSGRESSGYSDNFNWASRSRDLVQKSPEDMLLFAVNKWLIAHIDAPEAKNGAFIGILGENIDLAEDLE
ncbi:MAG: DUF4867 family protein, partial [Lachnospiraceae bacterium]